MLINYYFKSPWAARLVVKIKAVASSATSNLQFYNLICKRNGFMIKELKDVAF